MSDVTLPVLEPALPEIFLACYGMAMLMLGVFRRDDAMIPVGWLSVAGLIVAAVLVTGFASGGAPVALNGLFVNDDLSNFLKILVLGAAALGIIMSLDFMKQEGVKRFELPVLMLFATLGMLMMLSANDLISLYMGLELQSLCLYVVAAIRRDSARAAEAGLKYFVLGALSSGMLLYGCSLIYGFSGTTDFTKLAEVTAAGEPSIGLLIGLIFVISALAFKVSAVPFHMWTPDVYEGAPTPITAFFAVAPKIAAIGLFTRVLMGPFHEMVGEWQQVVIFISMASMILGALAALVQTNIKRLLAYSSIGHMGYALVGLASGTEDGVRGVVVYVAIYLFMNIGTFACVIAMRRDGRTVDQISDLAGLSKTHPMMAACLAVFMFSMAGIPPLAGFFGKLYVFLAAIEAELYALAIVGVVSSVVAAFYYLRIIKLMYFDDVDAPLDTKVSRELTLITAGTGLVTLLFFLFPAAIITGAATAALSLFQG